MNRKSRAQKALLLVRAGGAGALWQIGKYHDKAPGIV